MNVHELTLITNRHVDFRYALDTYVIYPWIRDNDELVRPLRIGPKDTHVAVTRIGQAGPDQLHIHVTVDDAVPEGVEQIRQTLVRCLQLDYPYDQIEELTHDDPVLAAAVAHRGLGRGKLYPDMFEALCGIICAQRTVFKRIYAMMQSIAVTFGDQTNEIVDGQPVYAFPTPRKLAAVSEEDLRAIKVGFRAKGLLNVATYLADIGYTWAEWRDRSPAELIPDLLGIKGVGPYTANMAVNLVYGHGGSAHVDTYVVDIIRALYLRDATATPEQVAAFVDQRWGALGETVLDYLTTDTEAWATTLGMSVNVRSGARG
jgi:N-glycosylase/DNA lyase